MTNAGRLFLYAGDRVDYVIVHNPAKARGDLFKASQFESQLTDFGAKAITLPAITPTTLLAAEKAESVVKRGLSFAELSDPDAKYLERLLTGEIQWALQRMFRQYGAIANLLLRRIGFAGKARCESERKSESRAATTVQLRGITYGPD